MMTDWVPLVRKVLGELRPDIEPSEIPDDDDLFSLHILDSFTMVNFVDALEKATGVTIPNEELFPQNLWKIEAVAEMLERLQTTR